MYTLYLFKANREIVFYITGGIGIMRQLYMVVKAVFICSNAQLEVPFHTLSFPVLIPGSLCAGTYKELHFHLLKLTHPENELTGYDLVTECLSDLCNPERN